MKQKFVFLTLLVMVLAVSCNLFEKERIVKTYTYFDIRNTSEHNLTIKFYIIENNSLTWHLFNVPADTNITMFYELVEAPNRYFYIMKYDSASFYPDAQCKNCFDSAVVIFDNIKYKNYIVCDSCNNGENIIYFDNYFFDYSTENENNNEKIIKNFKYFIITENDYESSDSLK